jgi:formylglycine-generating enzyme required for sulfatase activity
MMTVRAFSLMCVRLWCGLLICAAATAVGAAETPKYFVKCDTWPETMLATRAAYSKRPQQGPLKLGKWHATGPHPAKHFHEALFPEQGVELNAKDENGKPRWKEYAEWVDGQVHQLTDGGTSATYLYRVITAPESMSLDVGLGSDDGIAVWLNGKQVHANNVARGVSPNSDRATLVLQPGDNQLLLKIYNSGGGHGFYFSANPEQSAALPELWKVMESQFPVQADWMKQHAEQDRHLNWFDVTENTEIERAMIERALKNLGRETWIFPDEYEQVAKADVPANDPRWLDLFEQICRYRHRPPELRAINTLALRLAIEDLMQTFGGRYRRGRDYLKRLDAVEKRAGEIEMAMKRGDSRARQEIPKLAEQLRALQAEALLDNPLIDFDKLLLIKRKADRLGLPQNWQGNCAIAKTGYDNEIAVLSPVHPRGNLSTFFRPDKTEFVGDVDLHFDADKMLFSMPGSNGRWQIWEIGADGKNLRQVTMGEHKDVDNYDACYLPDERIIFDSTRCFQGVPCVGGGNTVANLFLMNPDGTGIRQLCFDQDHDWCPTVLNNGRVLYSRWEYSDSPHYFTRILFHMNPDGTSQMEYYASNSYWPNSIFYARPIPNHQTMVVAVISGHHGVPRMGELVLFDPARGRREADGAVQRIPGYRQKVEPRIADGLVNGSWPKFLHPYPLSDKYFLVSCQPTNKSVWGIYLVDIFDNIVPIKEVPGYVLFEPVPLRKKKKPRIIPDKVDLTTDEATVYLADIYFGDGLQGIPRGTVKRLRLFEQHYAYPGMGGHINIGIDGPWDAKRILGTVPVESDGSANFKVPANMPIAVQPLDEQGRAVQIMRSWFTAMPGETLSCNGCHEDQNTSPPPKGTVASSRPASEITPWYGPARGFGFKREVQPVLDKYCVGCHNPTDSSIPDFERKDQPGWRNFTPAYVALHPYVRRPGPESDYHLQKPMEYHASTSELVQMLEQGHYNVKLDDESWDRLVTWIDLNVPDHGSWHEHRRGHSHWEERRCEMRSLYANRSENPEEELPLEFELVSYIEPQPLPPRRPPRLRVNGWPFNSDEARRRQATAANEERPVERKITLADGIDLELALIPAGEFIMGDAQGEADEYPPARVVIDSPFYMGKFEITNAQYAAFDPDHDSAYISVMNKDQGNRGEAANRDRQPVIRITWRQAMVFCEWLSKETGLRCSLPTEAQWEYACRAGTATPLYYGNVDTNFAKLANLADERVNNLCRRDSPKWIPSVSQVSDGAVVSVDVGRYEPNAWGLHDMHGNVAEWTRTSDKPYPYNPRDGRDSGSPRDKKVARGGSWYDRPHRARSAHRLRYQPWQPVFNVGFRIVVEAK